MNMPGSIRQRGVELFRFPVAQASCPVLFVLCSPGPEAHHSGPEALVLNGLLEIFWTVPRFAPSQRRLLRTSLVRNETPARKSRGAIYE
jgi:hypothetical protein